MLVIGSAALVRLGYNLGTSAPKDLDVIATFDELNKLTDELRTYHGSSRVRSMPISGKKTVLRVFAEDFSLPSHIEVEIAWSGSTGDELLQITKTSNFIEWNGPHIDVLRKARIASLDILYTLKMSHRYLKNSVHFEKTMEDIRRMRMFGARIFDEKWLKRREEETYTYDHPNLNTTKSAFFKMNEGVNYIFDHDSIHLAMAHLSKANWDMWKRSKVGQLGDVIPAYKLYAGEGEVISSKEKFFSASEAVRLYGVLEEAQVLALERSQIPYGVAPQYFYNVRRIHNISQIHLTSPPSPRRSFDIALEKVCTSITSGWFREFAWENYDTIMSMYESDYVDRFWDAVKSGIVFRTQDSLKKERLDQEKQDDYRRDLAASRYSLVGHGPDGKG